MSAWVAAIRPGFASLLDNFLDRKPYSTGVDELDNLLSDSFHYMLYQESIMKYLVFLGIEEKETYDIVKKIAKKKFTDQELSELKNKLQAGWLKQVGSIDGFDKTWQVVQDAAHYSFNASHSLSVAIDSLYGAYLKSHYPLEYFTVALSMYHNDLPRTSNLIKELSYFNIELLPICFGKSKADYTMDKKTNSIYKGVASIKFCNEKVAYELYQLSKNQYSSFVDLLADIQGKTSVTSRQLIILTGLNFFKEFGKNKYLLNVIKIYNKFKTCKQINKTKLEELGISEYLISKYAGKETKALYKEIDNKGLIKEMISHLEDKAMGIVEHIHFEKEYLEYITYTNEKADEKYYIVVDFIQNKNVLKPRLTVRNVKTGEEIKTRIKQGQIFREAPFGLYSILKISSFSKEFKRKPINGVWVETEELEDVLSEYEVVR